MSGKFKKLAAEKQVSQPRAAIPQIDPGEATPTETPKLDPKPASQLAKQPDSSRVQLNVRVSGDKRTALRYLALDTNREIGELVDEALDLLLKAHKQGSRQQ